METDQERIIKDENDSTSINENQVIGANMSDYYENTTIQTTNKFKFKNFLIIAVLFSLNLLNYVDRFTIAGKCIYIYLS